MGLYAKHVFPRILDWALRSPEAGEQRHQVLEAAKGEVLEIGFGTGLNLRYYPEAVTRVIAIDTERMLPEKVAQRLAQVRLLVEQMQLDASGRLPFDDNTFDTAVSTWTLCSIEALAAALAELRRVLKPEGQFLFLEHGRSDNPKVARWQDRLNPLQKIIGCGCNMNRPIDRLIEAAGFKIIRLDRFLMPNTPQILGEMYRGIATPNKQTSKG